MNKVLKILKYIWVLQEVSNINREPILGRGFRTAKRFNPYNPLSYVTVIILLIVALLMLGFYGMWKEVDYQNPFKWH